jgi:AcrR family transcriptional regulator
MPRDTLTREQIIKAAIDLLDAEGLEGLNMRALGTRLGSAATAVYWHVGSKDHLITLAGDHVWNEITLPDLTDLTAVDWRTPDRLVSRIPREEYPRRYPSAVPAASACWSAPARLAAPVRR